MVANTTMEMAVVGPDTRCQDEPHSAATMAGSMAAYKPYSGGMPAMVAKATPCGTRIRPPVKPAIRSARSVPRLTSGHQRKKGSQLRVNELNIIPRYLPECSGSKRVSRGATPSGVHTKFSNEKLSFSDFYWGWCSSSL